MMRVIDGTLERETSPDGMKITFMTHDICESDYLFDRYAKRGEKQFQVEIKPIRKKRSNDANSYFWILAERIADVVNATREEVYRRAVREVGVFSDIAIESKALRPFVEQWSKRGIGWFTEVFDSKLEGCKKIRCYYGSSTYDTKQMSRLIDYIVEEAKELEIPTETPDEISRMKAMWGEMNG